MTLDDLRRAAELLPPGSSLMLPRDAVLEAIRSTSGAVVAPEDPERWLTAEECSQLLTVTPRWCYDHAKDLGAKRLSRRCVRFSSRAVQRYLARRG